MTPRDYKDKLAFFLNLKRQGKMMAPVADAFIQKIAQNIACEIIVEGLDHAFTVTFDPSDPGERWKTKYTKKTIRYKKKTVTKGAQTRNFKRSKKNLLLHR